MPRFCLLLACYLVLSVGCSGKKQELTLKLAKDAPYAEAEFKASEKEQQLTVTISNGTADLLAWLVLMDHKDEAVGAILQGKKPRKALASSDSGKEVTVESNIPAGKGVVLLVRPAKTLAEDIELKLDVKAK